MTFRLWVGLWQALILLALVAWDVSTYVRYITRFTEESFSCLVSLIFVYEALTKAFTVSGKKPSHSAASSSSLQAGAQGSTAQTALRAGFMPIQAGVNSSRSVVESVSGPLIALLTNQSRANLTCSCAPTNGSENVPRVGLSSKYYRFDCTHLYGMPSLF